MSNKPFTYVGVPYSHEDEKVRLERFDKVNKLSAKLMNEGKLVLSPISMGHPIACVADLPKDWEYWEAVCIAGLSCSYEMYLLKVDGWEESVGVQAEIKIAEDFGIRIVYVEDEEQL
jgi:hypothetical protein